MYPVGGVQHRNAPQDGGNLVVFLITPAILDIGDVGQLLLLLLYLRFEHHSLLDRRVQRGLEVAFLQRDNRSGSKERVRRNEMQRETEHTEGEGHGVSTLRYITVRGSSDLSRKCGKVGFLVILFGSKKPEVDLVAGLVQRGLLRENHAREALAFHTALGRLVAGERGFLAHVHALTIQRGGVRVQVLHELLLLHHGHLQRARLAIVPAYPTHTHTHTRVSVHCHFT